jgi:hypothetical protein
MGNAYYEIYRNGEKIEAGYGVEAVCEEDGCEEKIDRGLAFLCGETPGGDEYGCGGYYCSKHLYMGSVDLRSSVNADLCKRCTKRQEEHETREPSITT